MEHKVLVVDDRQEIRDLLADILKTRGYQVSTATDGYDALTQFALDRPDLLITDLTMPGMDGYELCRITRGISSVPIMVVTAQLGSGARSKALAAGAGAFVTKPFDLGDFWSQVEAMLNVNSMHHILQEQVLHTQ